MPRRKPISTRQKKEAIKLKRAVKRGDVQKDDLKPQKDRHRDQRPGDPSRKLQSAFVQLPKEFLDKSKHLCSSLALQRPIQNAVAVFDPSLSDSHLDFICPRRPKWHYDFSKLQVERNEEGIFRKWLEKSDAIVSEWRASGPDSGTNDSESMPRSTCYFERNIEVWRQLWRVTEISQIILVLLDSRCPLLHYPPSLANYLSANNRKHILVLTKVDIVGPSRANAWTEYFRKTYPGTPIIQVESYIEKEPTTVHQGKARFEPRIPETFRERLIDALKRVHEELLTPPEKILKNPDALARWKPPVRRVIDWAAVIGARGGKVGSVVGGALIPQQAGQEDGEENESQFLTVGLIGQPNVGKSSLLNALFGVTRVRASKAPGMTKHLQTHFWTQDIRLVDCPGLVVPNLTPMELQVLSGILPISRIAAVPACVHFISQYLPLELIFKLTHPMQGTTEPIEDKRTWRDGASRTKNQVLEWTAMDIMVAYANLKGWQTAKAGRPDIHRAGNAMLRALAEGRISWAFWPPDTDVATNQEVIDAAGIWISNSGDVEWDEDDTDTKYDSEGDDSEGDDSDSDDTLTLGEYESEESDGKEEFFSGHGRFAMLSLEDDSE